MIGMARILEKDGGKQIEKDLWSIRLDLYGKGVLLGVRPEDVAVIQRGMAGGRAVIVLKTGLELDIDTRRGEVKYKIPLRLVHREPER